MPTAPDNNTAGGSTPPAGGQKLDAGKPPLDLLDRVALEEIARVLDFGRRKYAAHNWRKGIALSRLLAACLRHVFAFIDGESKDPESGLSHLAHAACCLMFALRLHRDRPDLDDRYHA